MESQVSLELVLVLVGICVVIGIYFISTWGKKGSVVVGRLSKVESKQAIG